LPSSRRRKKTPNRSWGFL